MIYNPEFYKLYKLKDLAHIDRGKNVSVRSDGALDADRIPWLTITDLNDKYLTDAQSYLSNEEAGKAGIKAAPRDTVFFSCVGTLGKMGISTASMFYSNNIIAIQFNKKIVLPLYGFYCIWALKKQIKELGNSNVYASLPLKSMRGIVIPVPSIELQQKIICIAEKAHELVYTREENYKSFSEMIKAGFLRIFSKALKNREFVKLWDVADMVMTGVRENLTIKDNKVKVITTKDLKNDLLANFENLLALSIDARIYANSKIKEKDIILNRVNSLQNIGKSCFIKETCGEIYLGQNLAAIRLKNSVIEPEFLFGCLLSDFVNEYIVRNAKESNIQASLNKDTILNIPVLYADEISRKKFVEYFYLVRDIAALQELGKTESRRLYEMVLSNLLQVKNILGGRITPEIARTGNIFNYNKEYEYCIFKNVVYFPAAKGEGRPITIPLSHLSDTLVSDIPNGLLLQLIPEVRTFRNEEYGDNSEVIIEKTNNKLYLHMKYYWKKDNMQLSFDNFFEHDNDFEELYWEQVDMPPSEILNKSMDFKTVYKSIVMPRKKDFQNLYKSYISDELKKFILSLSDFQQSLFEEFIISPISLAAHIALKRLLMRDFAGKYTEYDVQGAVATIRLLENAGLLVKDMVSAVSNETADKDNIFMDVWGVVRPRGSSV